MCILICTHVFLLQGNGSKTGRDVSHLEIETSVVLRPWRFLFPGPRSRCPSNCSLDNASLTSEINSDCEFNRTSTGTLIGNSYLCNLSEDDRNILVNRKLVDVVMPEVFLFALNCIWNKNDSESVLEYLTKIARNDETVLRKYIKDNKIKLRKDYRFYDVTMLHSLVYHFLEHSDEISAEMKESLLKVLRIAKNLRNSVIHDKAEAAAPGKLPDIENALTSIVRCVGTNFHLDEAKISHKVIYIIRLIREVESTAQTTKVAKMNVVSEAIRTEGSKEQSRCLGPLLVDEYIPFSGARVPRHSVFHKVKLDIIEELTDESISVNPTNQCNRRISCEEILDEMSVRRQPFAFIVGPPGSGKSCFLKQVALDHCNKEKSIPVFSGSQGYSSMIFFTCRDTIFESLSQYIRKTFSKVVKRFEVVDVLDAMTNLKLLVLIDGLDEQNNFSRHLVNEVIEHFKHCDTVKFIITSRPGFDLDVRNKLDREGIGYMVLSIRPIENINEQIEYLERYQAMIPEVTAPGLVDAFKKQQDRFRVHFIYAANLALFCHLYKNLPQDVADMTHEGNLMEQTLKLCRLEMEKRAEVKIIDNVPQITMEVIKIICHFCLKCLQGNVLKINQHTYAQLAHDCFKINKDIPVDSMLSCLLQKRKSFISSDSYCFEFFHKSQQEYLASQALLQQLLKKCKPNIRRTILQIVKQIPRNSSKLRAILSDLTGLQVNIVDMKK